MSTRSKYLGIRRIAYALLWVAGATAFDSRANPILIYRDEVLLAAPQNDERAGSVSRRFEPRLRANARPSPPPVLEMNGITFGAQDNLRFDGNAPENGADAQDAADGNPFGVGGARADQASRNYGNARQSAADAQAAADGNPFGQRDARANQTSLHYGSASAAGLYGSEFSDSVQKILEEAVQEFKRQLRDAVVDESGRASLSIWGLEIELMLRGERRLVFVYGTEVWSMNLSGTPSERAQSGAAYRLAGRAAAAGSAQPSGAAPEAGAVNRVRQLIADVIDFVTDPVTITLVLVCLMLWFMWQLAFSMRR